jgi:hypothetical protein
MDRSAARAARFADRTDPNVATASTKVPPAVAREEIVTQSATAARVDRPRGPHPKSPTRESVRLSGGRTLVVTSREGVRRGLPPRVAVEAGISETAGVVASAAAVMVSVFSIFAALSLIELKQIRVGLAVSVLVDATLVRVVMLPSLLVLMGRAAWWPSRPPTVQLTQIQEPTAAAALPELGRERSPSHA